MDWLVIFIDSVVFLLLLHILGHPITRILCFSKFGSFINDWDFVQRLPLEFVIGGTVVYIWALISSPFQLFDFWSCSILTIVGVVVYVYLEFSKLRIRLPSLPSVYSIVALGGFILSLLCRIIPLSGFSLGSVQDTSLHTLFVYSILRNQGIPTSAIPGFTLQDPMGLHVVLAYFTLITGVPPEFVTFWELAFFNATIVLAVYTFSSKIFSNEFGLIVSLLLVNLSFYPIGIDWGGQWIPWGLTIFFVGMTLWLEAVKRLDLEEWKNRLILAVLPGLIFGYLGSTYPPLLALGTLMTVLFILFNRKQIVHNLSFLVTSLLFSIPLMFLWIYRLYAFNNNNSAYLSQASAQAAYDQAYKWASQFLPFRHLISLHSVSETIFNWTVWPIQVEWPFSAYFYVAITVIGTSLAVMIALSRDLPDELDSVKNYIAASFVTVLIWGINSPLGLFYIPTGPLGILASEIDKVEPLVGTFLLPFLAALPLYLIILLVKHGRSHSPVLSGETRTKLVTAILIAVLVSASFVTFFPATRWLQGNTAVFAVSSPGDYELLQWMRNGIPRNSTVLVAPYDAGQYVQSISDKRTIGLASTGVIFLTPIYEQTYTLLLQEIVNATTISDLRAQNINYIFVGSNSFSGAGQWSANFFLQYPNYFQFVKNFTNSYLFKVIVPSNSYHPIGIVNGTNYEGISDGNTLIDFRHMVVYDLSTGQSMYFEIDVKTDSGSFLSVLNEGSPPESINSSYISKDSNGTRIQTMLSSSNDTLTILTKIKQSEGLDMTIISNTFPRLSVISFSFYPVYYVRTGNYSYSTRNVGFYNQTQKIPIEGYNFGGTSFFKLVPYGSSVFSNGAYMTDWNWNLLELLVSSSWTLDCSNVSLSSPGSLFNCN
ncbi:MAG: hypothetical protein ACYCQJ_00670 [Nitrososphaerales archaeon]